MDVEFEDEKLAKLESDRDFDAGLEQSLVRTYRMRLQLIRAAADERAFYALKSLHFEKLKGDRAGQHSMRLNSQWRLIMKIRKEARGKFVVVISITDYH
jgi:proteic killer suppression protein